MVSKNLPVGALARLGFICCCFIFLFDSIFGTLVFSFFFSGFSDFFSVVDVVLVPDVDVEDNTSGLKSIYNALDIISELLPWFCLGLS